MAAVAERIAAQKAPRRQHEAANRAERPHRLDGVRGAGRLVLAAPREQGGDKPLVEPYGRGEHRCGAASQEGPAATSPVGGQPSLPSSSASSRRTPSRPSRLTTSAAPARATTT